MKAGVVSVVLPIYGVERYLDRCIQSIVNQTYSNLEILLVDDGSPDNCPAMCDVWAEKDARIKVIHKINAGLGMARNTGIEHATGEYICFFDSDDYVAPDTIEKAYALARRESSDMVIFGLHNVDKNGTVVNSLIPVSDKISYEGKDVQCIFLPDLIATTRSSHNRNLYMSACLCLYALDMIRKSGWRFASEREIISEDVFSLLCLYKHVKKVSVLSEALYYYCENGSSLSRTYRADRFEKICHFHATSVNKARALGYGEEAVCRLQVPFTSFVIAAMKMIVQSDSLEKEKKKEIKKIITGPYLSEFQWDHSLKHHSPKRNLFVFLMRKQMWRCCYMLLKLAGK